LMNVDGQYQTYVSHHADMFICNQAKANAHMVMYGDPNVVAAYAKCSLISLKEIERFPVPEAQK